MPRSWTNDAAPFLDAANLNALEGELSTSLWSAAALSTKTANYTATTSDKVLIFNGSNLTATLPDPTTVANRIYIIKNIHSSALTLVSAGTSKTIDGAASAKLPQYLVAALVSDGTTWFSLSGLEMVQTATFNPVVTGLGSGSATPFRVVQPSGSTSEAPVVLADASASGNAGTIAVPAFKALLPNNHLGMFFTGYRGAQEYFRLTSAGEITVLSGAGVYFGYTGGHPSGNTAASGNTWGLAIAGGKGGIWGKTQFSASGASWQPVAFSADHTTKTANYTITNSEQVVVFNGTSLTATLPDPTLFGYDGRVFKIKNINSTALTIVSAGTSKTIDGAASKSLAQWEKLTVISDGTQWLIL